MMGRDATTRIVLIHVGILAAFALAQFVLPPYHHTNFARIMVLGSYAIAYNIVMGYTGLLSLGHAMFFAAGLYGAGLMVEYHAFGAPAAFGAGLVASLVVALTLGAIALRTSGVSFLIVTMMFAQACFLATLYFNEWTLGDQGFVVSQKLRPLVFGGVEFPFSEPVVKYNVALAIFAVCFLGALALVRSPTGRILVAIRENEARTRMLGYHTYRYKLLALTISGVMSGATGAAYALVFSYVGSSFASIEYSIFPMLWVLVGGAGTTLGPVIGTALMFYLVDYSSEAVDKILSSDFFIWLFGDALTEKFQAGDFGHVYLFVVGATLIILVLWFPKGIMGSLRDHYFKWMP